MMNVFQITLKILVLYLTIAPSCVMAKEPSNDSPTRTFADYIKDYVDVPPGGIDWRLLGKTKEISIKKKAEDGHDAVYQKPNFQPELIALDGKEVIIKGFMFPLDAAENQKHFLLGPFPLSCPFHYHVSPSLVVEVHADKAPMTFSYDPVILKGTLELVTDDPVMGIFYKLNNASDIDYAAPSLSERFSSYLNLSSIRLKAFWGNSAAQFKLGVLYYHGQGVMQDNEKAVYWFKKSSDQGYVPAQSILGALYYYGTGVTKDYEAALFWLTLAGFSGGQEISELHATIADKLGPEKVLEIQKRAETWHINH